MIKTILRMLFKYFRFNGFHMNITSPLFINTAFKCSHVNRRSRALEFMYCYIIWRVRFYLISNIGTSFYRHSTFIIYFNFQLMFQIMCVMKLYSYYSIILVFSLDLTSIFKSFKGEIWEQSVGRIYSLQKDVIWE